MLQSSLGQGNVFTGVCLSTVGGGVSVPTCITGYMTRGFSVQEEISLLGKGGHCPGRRVSVQAVSVLGGGLCQGEPPPYGNKQGVASY